MGRAGPHGRPALGLSAPADCAALTAAEVARLRQAAQLLRARNGLVPRVTAWLGGHAERAVRLLGAGWRDRVEGLVGEALWRAQSVALVGLDPVAGRPSSGWFSRAATTASGAATGLAGLPGALVDIPVSTLLILRSIAAIARDEGEDIASPDGRRACLEVLAIGGPGAADDEAEVGYWSARLGLAALNMRALIPQAARLLGGALSEKLVAQAVPLVGAVAGAGLNYAILGYYQTLARAHFIVRSVERDHPGDPAVGLCFERLLAEAAPYR